MKIEKIIKRDGGKRVKICVSVHVEHYRGNEIEYKTFVLSCEKGKRTWKGSCDRNDYTFRRLSMDDRNKFEYESQFNLVTIEELNSAKLELWHKIKPI